MKDKTMDIKYDRACIIALLSSQQIAFK